MATFVVLVYLSLKLSKAFVMLPKSHFLLATSYFFRPKLHFIRLLLKIW